METKKRMIDAMQTVTKMSARVAPLIHTGASSVQVYDEVLRVIGEAPTVDAVEVVHGRWNFDEDLAKWGHPYVCSACGMANCSMSKYCPNCGAKMDGGDEDV